MGYRTSSVAYAIDAAETLHASILRLMDEQIIRARETLDDRSLPPATRVHDARKRFKEIRAVIHLVREPLGPHYAVEDAWFRDAGRDLATARDADAVAEALDGLALPLRLARRAHRILQAGRAEHPPLEPLLANVIDQLVLAQGRTGLWPAIGDSFDSVAPGLRRAYREGRRGFRRHGTAQELHEWRKSVKEQWHHTLLLRNVWPEMMKTSADALSSLARALGSHHDLHVLQTMVGDALPPLSRAIETRQAGLEKEARAIGARVYAETPDAWLARIRKYWRAWHRTSA